MRGNKLVAAACLSLAMTGLAAAQTAEAPDPTPESLREVVVTARPGPALWRVFDADSEILVMAVISPLPAGMTWNSRLFEAALARADRFYLEEDLDIGLTQIAQLITTRRNVVYNPNGARLGDFADPSVVAALEVRLAPLGQALDDVDRHRPWLIGNRLVMDHAKEAGLDFRIDVAQQARRLARRARVRTEEVGGQRAGPLLDRLHRMPTGADLACLTLQIDVVDRIVPEMGGRAVAWARGDVAALRALSDRVDPASCTAGLSGAGIDLEALQAARITPWLETVQQALARPGVRVAVVDGNLWLRDGGLLDSLRAAGHAVEGG